jgi:CBS domain-containing protein
MYLVRQILESKGYQVWWTQPDATVYDALQLMSEKDVGALVVLESDGKLAGIFSERDYARKVILFGKNSKDTPVGEIMTASVFTVEPGEPIEKCMELMTARHIRHLPVVEDKRVIGIISIGDVVKAVISQKEFVIEQLENYITGER